MQQIVTLGKFGATYGIRGWLRIISFTDPNDNILRYPVWHIKQKEKWTTLNLEVGKPHRNQLIVKLKEINDLRVAREYTNHKINIPRETLATLSENEFYWEELIDSTVITKDQVILGKVRELLSTGSNDVFVVTGEREHLVPYTQDVVIKIDKYHKKILVDWDSEF